VPVPEEYDEMVAFVTIEEEVLFPEHGAGLVTTEEDEAATELSVETVPRRDSVGMLIVRVLVTDSVKVA